MKFVSPIEAVGLVKSGDTVVVQGSTSIPMVLLRALTERASELRDVKIISGFGIHPEDAPYMSNFVGCRYAEARAYIACEQYKREVLDNQIKGLRDFENILKGKWDYNEHSMESKRLRRRIHELKEERATVKDKIAAMKKALKKSMDERDEFVKTKINDDNIIEYVSLFKSLDKFYVYPIK